MLVINKMTYSSGSLSKMWSLLRGQSWMCNASHRFVFDFRNWQIECVVLAVHVERHILESLVCDRTKCRWLCITLPFRHLDEIGSCQNKIRAHIVIYSAHILTAEMILDSLSVEIVSSLCAQRLITNSRMPLCKCRWCSKTSSVLVFIVSLSQRWSHIKTDLQIRADFASTIDQRDRVHR